MAVVDPVKTSLEEMRKMNYAQIKETEEEVRRDLLKMKLDVYTAPSAQTSKVRNLKKTLAKVMTVKTEKRAEETKTRKS